MRFTPSTIQPQDFEYLTSYCLPADTMSMEHLWLAMSGHSDPFGIKQARALVEQHRHADNWRGLFSCTVCGAHFLYGELWLHRPTGELAALGHICAGKYSLVDQVADGERRRLGKVRAHLVARVAKRRARWESMRRELSENPWLGAALRQDGDFPRMMRQSFIEWGRLTERQAAALQQWRPREEEPEAVAIPQSLLEGRVEVTGRILGVKAQESAYGTSWKMLLAVDSPGGRFKLWGTVPAVFGFLNRPSLVGVGGADAAV